MSTASSSATSADDDYALSSNEKENREKSTQVDEDNESEEEEASDEEVDIIGVSDEETPAERGGEKWTKEDEKSTEENENNESEEEASGEEVDIIGVSDEETPAERGGEKWTEEEMKIVNTDTDQEATLTKEMEIEKQNFISINESTEPASSSTAVVEDQESSESSGDEKTETPIIQSIPPNFPSQFAKLIEDPESICPRILIEKRLHKSDVDVDQDRLSIKGNMIREPFLLTAEKKQLKSGEVVQVQVIEPCGTIVKCLTLRKRRSRGMRPRSYALTGGWDYTVARNSDILKRGGFVRVWYFRVNGGLWFAVEALGS